MYVHSCLEPFILINKSYQQPWRFLILLPNQGYAAQAWFDRRFENHRFRMQNCSEW